MYKYNYAKIFRSVRKHYGNTIKEFSDYIRISHKNLKIIEAQKKAPSVEEWMNLVKFTNIDSDCYQTGLINFSPKNANVFTSKFEMNNRYIEKKCISVRYFLPLLNYFSSILGEKKMQKYFKHLGIDEDYMIFRDNMLNLNFAHDLFYGLLIDKSVLSIKNIPGLAQSSFLPEIHGKKLYDYYLKEKRIDKKIKRFNNTKYEIFSNLIITKENDHTLLVDRKFKTKYLNDRFEDDLVQNSHCAYFKSFLKNTLAANGQNKVSIDETECIFSGGIKCHYIIKTM